MLHIIFVFPFVSALSIPSFQTRPESCSSFMTWKMEQGLKLCKEMSRETVVGNETDEWASVMGDDD
jgi:hypothetical protein